MEYLITKISELQTNSKNKNIRVFYRGIDDCKDYQPRTSSVKEENGDLLVDSHSNLARWGTYVSQLFECTWS